MNKKEIYEHLAKIYLDASLKKSEQRKQYPHFKYLFFASLAVILGLAFFLLQSYKKDMPVNLSETALIIQTETTKINFDFIPAKKEIFSISLDGLNLAGYKALAFSVKKADFNDTISLRLEFSNKFKETSEVYLKNIPHKWQDYKIAFSEFRNLNDWSEMSKIAFIVEEWNTRENKGVVYIDNVRFIK